MRTYTFQIGAGEAGQRLDHYLVHRLPAAVSRAMIQRGIRAGDVTVGGSAPKPHRRQRSGDTVVACFACLPSVPSRGLPVQPQEIPLDVVYEDDALLVVNKPAGLVTHPAPGHWAGTLVNALAWHVSRQAGQASLARAGIIHRLDKETSGLLLVAKTETAHVALSRDLKARRMHREYVALVDGLLPLDRGTINVPIGRHLTHRKQMTVRHLGGRSAVTHYRVARRVPAAGDRPAYTVVEVGLETGRTHQIRVHFAHLDHPVMGDATYGRHPASYWQDIGVPRQMLHAYRLTLSHPVTARPMTFSAPLPADLASWIPADALSRPS